jgi:hypothetical protein
MTSILWGRNFIGVGPVAIDTSGTELDLTTCIAKAEEAAQHLRSINDEFAGFFESHPYSVTGEFEADSRWYVFTISRAPKPSPSLRALVVDYVRELRTILDLWLTELRRWEFNRTRKGRPRGAAPFPIYTDPTKFADYLTRSARQLAVLPEHWHDLLGALQPCNRAGSADVLGLALIDELSNARKHASLYTPRVLRPYGPTWVPLQDVTAVEDPRIQIGRQLVSKAEIARVRIVPAGPNPKVEMHGSLPVTVEFEGTQSGNATNDLSWNLWNAGVGVFGLLAAFPTGPRAEDNPLLKEPQLFTTSFATRIVTAGRRPSATSSTVRHDPK